MRRLLPAVIASALPLVATTASAAGPDDSLRLRWSAPAGCPSSEAVRAATLRGIDARAPTTSELLEADARVEQVPSPAAMPWKVRLVTRRGGSTGEREIEAASCAALAEATAVVLGLALVPAPEPVPADPAPVPDAPAARSPGGDAAPKRAKQGDGHALAFGVSVAGDAASLPSLAVGGSVSLGWTPGRLRVEADARRWGSQSGSLAGTSAGARFTMTSIGGRVCFTALKTAGFDVSPCAGGDANLISASGFGADTNYAPDAAWATVTGGGLGRIALGPWLAVRARFEAVVPLSRPTFVVENEGTVHRSASFGAAATLGVEALFL